MITFSLQFQPAYPESLLSKHSTTPHTKENKKAIDSLSYGQLLYKVRFAPMGDPWFEGETGIYWGRRMGELKNSVDHVRISKEVGWGE